MRRPLISVATLTCALAAPAFAQPDPAGAQKDVVQPAAAPAVPAAPAAPAVPAAPAAPEASDETEIPKFPREANVSASPMQPEQLEAPVAEVAGFEVGVSGYARVQYQAIFEDPEQTPDIGRNDGFAMDSARLIVQALKGPVEGYISIDGAVDRFDRDGTRGSVQVGLKDAYVGYARDDFDYVKLRFGQFKPPFDAEEQQSTRDILFTDRAVESRGVRSIEGDRLSGLSLDREVGAMLYGDPYFGDFGLAYYLSVTNGTGANRALNDNDALAYTGRLELRWAEIAAVGFAVNHNRRTTGDLIEDEVDEELLSMVADVRGRVDLEIVRLVLQGQYMQRTTSYPDVAVQTDRVEAGWHAALGVEVPYGFVIAYRYATLDPWSDFDGVDATVDDELSSRGVTHHTIGLNWTGGDAMPMKLQLNYTLAMEEDEARPIDNDRLDALVQVSF